MVLRKITVDISVRCIPIFEKRKEKDLKSIPTKPGSFPRKQNKKLSQNNEKMGC